MTSDGPRRRSSGQRSQRRGRFGAPVSLGLTASVARFARSGARRLRQSERLWRRGTRRRAAAAGAGGSGASSAGRPAGSGRARGAGGPTARHAVGRRAGPSGLAPRVAGRSSHANPHCVCPHGAVTGWAHLARTDGERHVSVLITIGAGVPENSGVLAKATEEKALSRPSRLFVRITRKRYTHCRTSITGAFQPPDVN